MTEGVAVAMLAAVRDQVDTALDTCARQVLTEMPGRQGEAIAYALRSPGKRVRPALLLASYQTAGGTDPAILGVATAVEIVHTYSLVHDDLPCMDDDDLRRGRPTSHRAFDVATATEVGWLLVPLAAETLAAAGAALGHSPAVVGAMARVLFEAGGIEGMVGGQWRDLEAEGALLDLDRLRVVHQGKTGALIRASVILGGMAAGAGPHVMAALERYGDEIGLAFQVADDLLDATATTEELGKVVRRDAVLSKSTYVSLLGIDGAREEAAHQHRAAVAALAGLPLPCDQLVALADYIVHRAVRVAM